MLIYKMCGKEQLFSLRIYLKFPSSCRFLPVSHVETKGTRQGTILFCGTSQWEAWGDCYTQEDIIDSSNNMQWFC
jgi:hypothetical protein